MQNLTLIMLCTADDAVKIIETAKERWCETEANRVAGEIALMSSEPNTTKAEAYFERALAVARQQQAKSWELRTDSEHGAALARSRQAE